MWRASQVGRIGAATSLFQGIAWGVPVAASEQVAQLDPVICCFAILVEWCLTCGDQPAATVPGARLAAALGATRPRGVVRLFGKSPAQDLFCDNRLGHFQDVFAPSCGMFSYRISVAAGGGLVEHGNIAQSPIKITKHLSPWLEKAAKLPITLATSLDGS